MYPRLFHIYGSVWVTTYGLFVALCLLVYGYCLHRHSVRKQFLSDDQLSDAVSVGIATGLLGGRLLFLLQYYQQLDGPWYQYLFPWVGGFAILGALVGAAVGVSGYLYYHDKPVLKLLDVATMYAPLAQSIARWGCLFAGCCYGLQTSPQWFTLTYTNPVCFAPLNVPLYPTQIMMSIASFSLFLVLRYVVYPHRLFNGMVVVSFFVIESFLRGMMDQWRGDVAAHTGFSFYQHVALGIIVMSIGLMLIQKWRGR